MSEDLLENGPESTHVEKAFEDLRSNDPDKRSSAIEMLVATPLSTMVATPLPILLIALDDKNARVRKVATTALGLKGDVAAIPGLLNLLQDKWVRETAVRALGQFGLPTLLPILQGRDAVLREVAVTALGTIGDATVISSLLDALTDPERRVRSAAEEALVKMGTAAATTVVNALNDEDNTLRSGASRILFRFRDQVGLPELLNALLNKDEDVRRAAAKVLGYKGDPAAIPALLNSLDDESHIVRAAAAEALGKHRGFADVPKLTKLLNDQHSAVRVAVVEVLGRIGDKATTPGLLNALDDPVSEVRQKAVDAFAIIRDTTAIPRLLAVLGDSNPSIRYSAARALGNIGDTSSVPGLLAALHDTNSLVRATAASALGRIGDSRAIAGLAELLSDTHPYNEPGSYWAGLTYQPPPSVNTAAAVAIVEIGRIVGEKTVLFSAYYPKGVIPKVWNSLYLYCYTITAAGVVVNDARTLLSKGMDLYRQKSEQTQQLISEGMMITATPSLDGFQFNPPSVTIGFYEDWHRVDFRLRASEEWLEKASNGFVTLTVEGVIVADIPLSIYVSEQEMVADTPPMTYRQYQAIFCSYSHRDEQIVKRVESAYKALGMDYLRDVTTLKGGQFWNEELLALIESADIFQLFWSKDSASSQYVEKEWRHALQLDREQSRFIRPVYWIQPMPHTPEELAHIHFSYVPDLST
jgi:HEAT repeat protein